METNNDLSEKIKFGEFSEINCNNSYDKRDNNPKLLEEKNSNLSTEEETIMKFLSDIIREKAKGIEEDDNSSSRQSSCIPYDEESFYVKVKKFIEGRRKEPNESMIQNMKKKLEKKLKRNDKFRKDYLIKELKTKILEFIKEELLSPIFKSKSWFKSKRIQEYLPYDFNNNEFNRYDKSSKNQEFLSYTLLECFSEGKKEENGKNNRSQKNYEQINEIINDSEIPQEERDLFKNIFSLTYKECIRLFYIYKKFSNYKNYELDEVFREFYANMKSNGKKDGKIINLLEENGFIYYCKITGNKKH